MGNSTGNLADWWALFRELRHAQGGFIWDWVDQGLPKTDDGSGATYWAYGGDFGERIHDAQFCINGLVFPDRTPHPALHEAKHVMRPIATSLVRFEWAGGGNADGSAASTVRARLRVTNHFDFVGDAELQALGVALRCSVQLNGVEIASAVVGAAALGTGLPRARESALINVELTLLRPPTAATEAFLVATWTLGRATSWCDAGHVLAVDQCVLPPAAV
eukprot:1194167-Prymnesium_polylepis.1